MAETQPEAGAPVVMAPEGHTLPDDTMQAGGTRTGGADEPGVPMQTASGNPVALPAQPPGIEGPVGSLPGTPDGIARITQMMTTPHSIRTTHPLTAADVMTSVPPERGVGRELFGGSEVQGPTASGAARMTSPGAFSSVHAAHQVTDRVTAIEHELSIMQHIVTFRAQQLDHLERDVRGDHERRILQLERLEETVQRETVRLEKMVDDSRKGGGRGHKEAMVNRRGLAEVPKLSGEIKSEFLENIHSLAIFPNINNCVHTATTLRKHQDPWRNCAETKQTMREL